MLTGEQIAANLSEIEKRIEAACARSGRDRSEVQLIAVSKMNPAEAVILANDAGQTVFGENKVQELCGKLEVIDRPVKWHLIGHLQTNKVKYIIGRVEMIHSVDSARLAAEIEKESEKKNTVTDILIEINIADEDTKFGVKPEELEPLLREICTFRHIRIRGLMTVAPIAENAEDNRVYFRRMRDLLVDINSKNIDNISMNVLSMGMSQDFEIAIEEGAHYIRVGTGIFGARDYSK